MITHLEQEIENIKMKVFEMADLSIEAISNAVEALKTGDAQSAENIIKDDDKIDRLEIEIDNRCINLLVTKQPAATNLRLVLSFLKINTDLERIGDLASVICKETIRLNGSVVKPLIDIPRMANLCIEMIKGGLEAFSEMNPDKAKGIIEMDKVIDDLNLQIYRELFSYMAENPGVMSRALSLIMISKTLERIGDHATNIAERAVYYIKGIDIRHKEVNV